tara:strand:+ start:485 stop:1354 length:870 start_codon:yes stop_codon:yes gene_type:complete
VQKIANNSNLTKINIYLDKFSHPSRREPYDFQKGKIMVRLKYFLTIFICLTLLSCGSDEAGTTNINNTNSDSTNSDASSSDDSSDINETSSSMDATVQKVTIRGSENENLGTLISADSQQVIIRTSKGYLLSLDYEGKPFNFNYAVHYQDTLASSECTSEDNFRDSDDNSSFYYLSADILAAKTLIFIKQGQDYREKNTSGYCLLKDHISSPDESMVNKSTSDFSVNQTWSYVHYNNGDFQCSGYSERTLSDLIELICYMDLATYREDFISQYGLPDLPPYGELKFVIE